MRCQDNQQAAGAVRLSPQVLAARARHLHQARPCEHRENIRSVRHAHAHLHLHGVRRGW